MGIDLKHGGRSIGKKHRTEPKSKDVYLRLLYKVSVTPPSPGPGPFPSPVASPCPSPPHPRLLFTPPSPTRPHPSVIWFLGKAYGRGV